MDHTFDRYEDKYIINGEQYRKLIRELSTYGYRDEFGQYPIASVYFDSAAFVLAGECIRSPYTNRKLRLRQYSHDPFRGNGMVMFELKERRNGKVHKIRSNMDFDTFRERSLKESVPETDAIYRQLRIFQKQAALRPRIWVQYLREAYRFDGDPDLRVTFDTEIACCRAEALDLNGEFRGPQIIFPRDNYLLEVKYSDTMPCWLEEMLQTNGIVRTDFSKYLLAYHSLFTETSG